MHSRFARQSYGSPCVGCASSSRPPQQSVRWRDLWAQDDGVAGGYIEDDVCTSPKHGEGAAVSKAWLSRPFYAAASARPKAYRIQALADPTRSDCGPAAANVS